jgi:LPXTG-motif cell wall-anchored protein
MSASRLEWEVVPSVCRRIAALLAVACLGVALPAPIVHAQSAGDQQYSDPFGGSSGSGGKKSSKTTTTGSTGELSPTPQTPTATTPSSGGGSAPSASGTSSTTTTTAPSAAATLPNTGIDARLLVIVGTVLLLAGVGLRLRSAPERF